MHESILIITPGGGDDQRENSDVTHCAIEINREGFDTLTYRLAVFEGVKKQLGAFKIVLEIPEGVSVNFFNEDALRLAENLEPVTRALVDAIQWGHEWQRFFDAEADLLGEACSDAAYALDWTIQSEFIHALSASEFYAQGTYKHASGAVNSPDIVMDGLLAAFNGLTN